MNEELVLSSALIGTFLMTSASFIASKIRKKEYFEPQILNRLLYRIDAFQSKNSNHFAGWLIHATMGLMCSIMIWTIIENFLNNLSLITFIGLGAICGIAGRLIWEAMFQFHPYPPRINFKEFYFHSFITHLFFGIGCWIAYILFR